MLFFHEDKSRKQETRERDKFMSPSPPFAISWIPGFQIASLSPAHFGMCSRR
jgi:hypothetical protein